jgi:hypothetical protein
MKQLTSEQIKTLEDAFASYPEDYQLRMIEDSLAPERRIFCIDVGNLPKVKAEQYLKEVMSRYRNKLVYDAGTGEVRDDKKFMSMMEDFWNSDTKYANMNSIQEQLDGLKGEPGDIFYISKVTMVDKINLHKFTIERMKVL